MLASGAAVGKAVAMLTVPIITRIYLPEHMGVLSVFTALTALMSPFGTLLYTMAIPLPRHDGVATNLAVLCVCILLVVTSLVTLFFWIFAPPFLHMLSMEKLLPFWWLLPLTIGGNGLYEILSNWAIREKAFKPLARTRVWQSLIGSITKIALGFIGLKPLGLLIGQVFTQTGGIYSLFTSFLSKFKATWRHVTRKRIWFVVKHYADFPKYRLPSQFLLIASSKLPLLFFTWQFGAHTTGQLGLALTIVAFPLTLFGQTTGQAYYAEISRIGREKPQEIYKITKSITKKLFLVSIPPLLVLMLFGPWLFGIVFGDAWREAGIFTSILSVYLMTQFISAPLMNIFTVFEKQNQFLVINFSRVLFVLILFKTSSILNFKPYNLIAFYSIGLSLQYTFISFLVFRVINAQCKKICCSRNLRR